MNAEHTHTLALTEGEATNPSDREVEAAADIPSERGTPAVELPSFLASAIASPSEDGLVDPSVAAATRNEALALGAPPSVSQVCFRTIDGLLTLWLPPEKMLPVQPVSEEGTPILEGDDTTTPQLPWEDLLAQLQQRLTGGAPFWQAGTTVELMAGDRLLDPSQLQDISEALAAHQLSLNAITTQRRQTAIAAATAGLSVKQGLPSHLQRPSTTLDDPLYVRATVRSGTEIRHSGTIVVFGDVNAGAELVADGDILVWGKLKGIAHAGASGNHQATIAALHLEATQLRIAHLLARVEAPKTSYLPEIARVTQTGAPSICIISAADYFSAKPSRS